LSELAGAAVASVLAVVSFSFLLSGVASEQETKMMLSMNAKNKTNDFFIIASFVCMIKSVPK
jgi:hypothetical protein